MAVTRISEFRNREQSLLWLIGVAFFMQTLDATIVYTALPAMARSLNEDPLRMHGVVISYSLAMATLIPASGWLADRFGLRHTFFSAIAVFAGASLLCALSSSLWQLIAARILQGAGGALLLPVGRLAVLRAFPRDRFLKAMSFVTVPGMIGPLIGPTLGGWLVEFLSWHWIFLINIPVGIIGCIMTRLIVPRHTRQHFHRFDFSGYLLLALSMVTISVGLDGASDLGFSPGVTIVLVMAGLALLATYWLRAIHHPEPLFPTQIFKITSFRIGLMGNLFSRIGSGAMPYLLPGLLQICLGYSPAQAGTMLIPTAAASIVSKYIGPGVIKLIGYRRLLVVNTLCVGCAMVSFALVHPCQSVGMHLFQFACYGAFNSMQFTAMNTVTLKDLEGINASSGNSMLSMVMMLSMSLGVALAGILLGSFTASNSMSASPAEVLAAFHYTFVVVGLVTVASTAIFWQLDSESSTKERDQDSIALG